ncbi:MAG: M16 family metallopeptidase [Chitinispirillaceae bacterium]
MKKFLIAMFFSAATTTAVAEKIDIPVTCDTLANGLRVIVVPDTNVAVVSCRLYYFVGGMNEGPGTSGLSHMYEHMMFKGTKRLGTKNYEKELPYLNKIDSLDALLQDARSNDNDSLIQAYRSEIFKTLEKQRKYVKKDEIWEIYKNGGGTNLNAWTGQDKTAYIVTLPHNKTELFYWIESDRMQNPVLREFHSEKDVVLEERRMRYDNRPLRRFWERMNALFYKAHPYGRPVIGWESEIRAYSTDKLMDHINRYYTPDNAVIILVGNVEPQKELEKIGKYFGDIPSAKKDRPEVVTREPAPIGETRFTVVEEAEPRVEVMFHTPGYPHSDLYALEIAQDVLSGQSGRLYKRMVNEEKLCTGAGAYNAFQLHNGSFHIYAKLKNDTDPKKVENIIREELRKLFESPPTDAEMLRVKNKIKMSFAEGLKSLEGLSDQLAYFERLNSWKDLLEYPDKINSIEKSSIPGTVAKYLQPDKATWGFMISPSQDEENEESQKGENEPVEGRKE